MRPEFNYGGQAVIEGVMMRGPESLAVAVRRPDSTIVIDHKPVSSITSRIKPLKWPMLRGVVVLFESLIVGLQALSFSANQAMEGEEEELTTRDIAITMALAFGLAILLFVVVPTGAAHLLNRWVQGSILQNLVEGLIRITVFLAYVIAIAQMNDIKRVFRYHGAEHKTINAYEAGEELTAGNVQRYATYHPRCGTSFLIIVLVVSIIVFAMLGEQVLWWRILSRILLLPVVAGISYELLKASARYQNNLIFCILAAPGKWVQQLTTGEPDDNMVEVAIAALKAVLKEDRGEVSVR
ncbi:Uncharacterized conserved protein YqhQ [Desulfotomaculum arcticum]|uniref:Uncharacterized conserved protein YqhQ n=1 Tax=Desulfotruncus arcticus DSM 17038 TaxID=1121424 RepID=A0A1I2VDM1_9FIRM|nr:DUF1385 domain-containing protein [Desulfotruncus arcticus]SFG87312.1 Uncharacterized conserved protein YqhQ [Desulfotomaculum arcticum] [Desulfotruncus arcticus DSM 17038]